MLDGKDGFIQQLIKASLERAMSTPTAIDYSSPTQTI